MKCWGTYVSTGNLQLIVISYELDKKYTNFSFKKIHFDIFSTEWVSLNLGANDLMEKRNIHC